MEFREKRYEWNGRKISIEIFRRIHKEIPKGYAKEISQDSFNRIAQ